MKHWKPDEDSDCWIPAQAAAPPQKSTWPPGATAGLALVAAACLAFGAVLYQLAGPSDVFAEETPLDGDR